MTTNLHTNTELDDLLAELERAERDKAEVAELRARLVKADELAEALKRIEHYPFAVTSNDQSDLRAVKHLAREALAAWESE